MEIDNVIKSLIIENDIVIIRILDDLPTDIVLSIDARIKAKVQ